MDGWSSDIIYGWMGTPKKQKKKQKKQTKPKTKTNKGHSACMVVQMRSHGGEAKE